MNCGQEGTLRYGRRRITLYLAESLAGGDSIFSASGALINARCHRHRVSLNFRRHRRYEGH